MSGKHTYKYDVAFSFAGAQRDYVEKVKDALKKYNVSVFYDNDNSVKLWGRNLYCFLDSIYSEGAQYCVMFISKEYKERPWATLEIQSAQERMFHQYDVDIFQQYILPVRFDDTQIPAIHDTTGYLDARKLTPEELADCIADKLGKTDKHVKKISLDIIFDKIITVLKKMIQENPKFTLTQEGNYVQVIQKAETEDRSIFSVKLLESYITLETVNEFLEMPMTITIFYNNTNNSMPIKVINFSGYLFQLPEKNMTSEELLQLLENEFPKILEVSNDTIFG